MQALNKQSYGAVPCQALNLNQMTHRIIRYRDRNFAREAYRCMIKHLKK